VSAAVVLLLVLTAADLPQPDAVAANTLRPGISLSPEQVVRAVVEGLRHNNSPIPNAGIYTAYRFASPANRAITGPYGRFFRAVKAVNFEAMFRQDPYTLGPLEAAGDRATQDLRIHVAGEPVRNYRFTLSRQTGNPYRGCWMVDGVDPLP
jgi:hypothetical protein